MANKKGTFIVFEGPDRSGKTTQINLLKDLFKKHNKKVIITREPGGTIVSEKIREILLDPNNKIFPITELFLYEASRSQHVNEKIIPSLKKGEIVISDRFSLASIVYQGYGRKIPLKLVEKLNLIATSNLKPDLTIVFLMPDKEFEKRERVKFKIIKEKPDRIESENNQFRKRINLAYKKISKNNKNLLVIDATKSIDEIKEQIISNLKKRFLI